MNYIFIIIIITYSALFNRFPNQNQVDPMRTKKVPFSMAIEKVELIHEYFPKHLRMGTSIMKEDKETEE